MIKITNTRNSLLLKSMSAKYFYWVFVIIEFTWKTHYSKSEVEKHQHLNSKKLIYMFLKLFMTHKKKAKRCIKYSDIIFKTKNQKLHWKQLWQTPSSKSENNLFSQKIDGWTSKKHINYN